MNGNGRNHEPDLREITAQLDGLSDLLIEKTVSLKDLANERDRLYMGKFEGEKDARSSALAAQDKLTAAAFASSEKAIVKAEEAQRAYNVAHNELQKRFDLLVPKAEAVVKWEGIDREIGDLRRTLTESVKTLQAEIASLRESRSEGAGKHSMTDPALAELAHEVQVLHTTMTLNSGKGLGVHQLWGIILGAAGLVSLIAGLFLSFAK